MGWGKSRTRRAQQRAARAVRNAAREQQRVAQLAQHTERQRAHAEYEQRWRAWDAYRRQVAAAQPRVCNYCKFWNRPDAVKCANCGAH